MTVVYSGNSGNSLSATPRAYAVIFGSLECLKHTFGARRPAETLFPLCRLYMAPMSRGPLPAGFRKQLRPPARAPARRHTNHPEPPMSDPTPHLTFDPTSRILAGPRGQVALDPGPALLVARMMVEHGKLVPPADLVDALELPPSVGSEADAVLRGHLRTARVLAAALTGGAWTLRMRGQEAAGLVGSAKPSLPNRPENRGAEGRNVVRGYSDRS